MDLGAYNSSINLDVTDTKPFQQVGDVDIEEMVLISSVGVAVSLLDYMVELNLYEYIFSNSLSGDIVISDSRNLVKKLPIIGEEIIVVKFRTPDSKIYINKCFKIYAIENRRIVRDQNTQVFVLKFCSFESILDSVSPIYSSFEGKITDVISEIYVDYLRYPRTLIRDGEGYKQNDNVSDLYFFNETNNSVKFVSPGWTPFQCINWLSSKSQPLEGKACNFLFWETNKGFYFGNIESIFEAYNNKNQKEKPYRLAATAVKGLTDTNNSGTDDLYEKMYLISDLEVVKNADYLDKLQAGYFASKNISLDLINKSYDAVVYDHLSSFKEYTHTSGKGGIGIFNNTIRNSHSHISYHAKSPGLFTDFKNNVSEISAEIYGNRISNLHELNLLKLNIVIPGRTDLEAGKVIELELPDLGPVDETDETKGYRDPFYSGSYLITALRHKITGGIFRYTISAEVVKDTLGDYEDTTLDNITRFADVL